MNNTFRGLSIFLAFTLVFASLLSPFAYGDPDQGNDKSITILFTHDLHDHFYPEAGQGGYARLYSAIEREREKDPQLLLVDGGDFSMGTLFQTIFSIASPQLRIMGKMGFDATTFGNHEFDFRPEGLAGALNAAVNSGDDLPEILASNMVFPTDKSGLIIPELRSLRSAMDSYGVKDYQVFERNGFRIGVFGLLGKDADSNAPMSVVEFENIEKRSKAIVDILKNEEQVDLIVCLSHSGTDAKQSKSEDEKLAKKVPEIDVIISGHTHTKLPKPIIVGNTIIGSCGNYGENLGYIKLIQKEDEDKTYWQLDTYKLIAIDDSIEPNPYLEEIIDEYKDIVSQEYLARFGLDFDQTIAYSPFNFTPLSELGLELKEDTLGNLIADSYIYAIEEAEGNSYEPVTISISPNGTIRGSFLEGNISVSDVFNVSSLGIGPDKIPGYPVLTVYLTGKELKTVAEVDVSVSPLMPAAQLYISGLRYTYNPYRLIFNKVTDVKIINKQGEEEEIIDDQLYRVAAGLYSAQMLSVVGSKSFGLLKVVPKDKDGIPIENFEGHIVYDQGQELKEWMALANYLGSFKKKNGQPNIPNYYSDVQGNKILNKDKNPVAILGYPNKISLFIYSFVLLFITSFLVLRYTKRKKKKDKFMFRR